MLNTDKPKDYVIASGHYRTLRDLIDVAFKHIGIEDWQKHIGTNPKFWRPADTKRMYGDSTRARQELGWEPKTSFEDMIKIMVDEDIKRLESE